MKKIVYILIIMLLFIPNIVFGVEETIEEVETQEVEEVKDNNENIEEVEDKLCNDENDTTYKCLVPKVDKDKKVYDFAELISDEEEHELYNLIGEFIESSKMDLVLVTINKNPYGVSDYYSKIYAQDFYYYNDFGVSDTKDGLIVLIDMDSRYPYIATKGNAILTFDDERINSIHEDSYNYLAGGNYFNALKEYVYSISNYSKKGIPDSNEYYCINESGDLYKCKTKPRKVNFLISFVVASITTLITSVVHLKKYRGIRLATNANSYLTNTNINEKTDQFLTTFTSRIRRSHDSGGSHSGGGSSTSHGSGGSFGGGGGRHF